MQLQTWLGREHATPDFAQSFFLTFCYREQARGVSLTSGFTSLAVPGRIFEWVKRRSLVSISPHPQTDGGEDDAQPHGGIRAEDGRVTWRLDGRVLSCSCRQVAV